MEPKVSQILPITQVEGTDVLPGLTVMGIFGYLVVVMTIMTFGNTISQRINGHGLKVVVGLIRWVFMEPKVSRIFQIIQAEGTNLLPGPATMAISGYLVAVDLPLLMLAI